MPRVVFEELVAGCETGAPRAVRAGRVAGGRTIVFLAARRGGHEAEAVGTVDAAGALAPLLPVSLLAFGGRPRGRFACDGAAGAGDGEAARLRFPDLPDCPFFVFAPAEAGAEIGRLLGLPRLRLSGSYDS